MTAFPDAPFGEADRIDLDGAPLAVIRYSGLRLDDLRTVFDTAYSALGRAVGAGTVVPSGPALAVYHGDPGELFDLEVGFPVAEALGGPVVADDTTIVPSTLPQGRPSPPRSSAHTTVSARRGDRCSRASRSRMLNRSTS